MKDNSRMISTTPEVRPPFNADWQARREFAEQLRRLNHAALTADIGAGELHALTETLRLAADRLEQQPRIYGRKAHAEHYARQYKEMVDVLYEFSPALGRSNAMALPMHVWYADGRLHGHLTADWSHEGPFDSVHGGVIALLFDQLLGIAQRVEGKRGYTGTLSIRYNKLTPLHRPLHLVATVKRVEGRKKFVAGEIWVDDVCTAQCEALFITGTHVEDPLSPLQSSPA
ncbi:MAG: PaaI family thioesterase [Rhodocyclaceae bacterium]|jgi:acyl-coenzyme A thioesterase PaaI-like protein|nr:PaaI family thioesterase [Rhodocyclaceae bacterium]